LDYNYNLEEEIRYLKIFSKNLEEPIAKMKKTLG